MNWQVRLKQDYKETQRKNRLVIDDEERAE
jgi:hypothetical protein